MKKTFLMVVLIMLLTMSGTLAAEGGWDDCEARQITGYMGVNGDVIYTTNPLEKAALTKAGFANLGNGINWWASPVGEPIYRLYNPASQRHLYTMDNNEVYVLTTQRGWTADNNGEPVFFSYGTYPVHRYYNRVYGFHLLVASDDPNAPHFYDDLPYTYEGIAFYGFRDVWGN